MKTLTIDSIVLGVLLSTYFISFGYAVIKELKEYLK